MWGIILVPDTIQIVSCNPLDHWNTNSITKTKQGLVEGDVNGLQADILGKVTGQLKIKELLQLRGKSIIEGEIYAGKLEVEPTATFNGSCHMGANVVELNVELGNVVNK